MKKPIGHHDTRRNRVATRLANLCLHIATPEYRNFIEAIIWYGMSAAMDNSIKGRPAPVDWRYALKKEDRGDVP